VDEPDYLKEELPQWKSLTNPRNCRRGQVAAQADTHKQALARKEAELRPRTGKGQSHRRRTEGRG